MTSLILIFDLIFIWILKRSSLRLAIPNAPWEEKNHPLPSPASPPSIFSNLCRLVIDIATKPFKPKHLPAEIQNSEEPCPEFTADQLFEASVAPWRAEFDQRFKPHTPTPDRKNSYTSRPLILKETQSNLIYCFEKIPNFRKVETLDAENNSSFVGDFTPSLSKKYGSQKPKKARPIMKSKRIDPIIVELSTLNEEPSSFESNAEFIGRREEAAEADEETAKEKVQTKN